MNVVKELRKHAISQNMVLQQIVSAVALNVIQGRTGRDLRGFNPNEFEILFPRGRIFLIQKLEGNTIYMEEVEDG